MFLLPFASLSKSDIATAGGKGANLGEMTQAGISCPTRRSTLRPGL